MINIPNIAAANKLVHAISRTGNDISSNVAYFQAALAEHTYAKQEIREQLVTFTSSIISQQQQPSESLNQLARLALDEMGKEVEQQPNDARIRLEYALGFRSVGDSDNALKQIAIAHELSPKKQTILLEQGINHWQSGNMEGARTSFHAAYELDTSFSSLAEYAAAGDIASGHVAEGKKLLTDVQGTYISDSEPLILAYFQAKQYTELIDCLKLQVKNQNGAPSARFRLAAAYLAAGRTDEARNEVTQTASEHPDVAAQVAEFMKHIPGGQ
jgi:Flp pilus assembly protein TadD